MQAHLTRLFNDIPIQYKLLLISTIPLVSLILFALMTYSNVRTFAQDEDRLNDLYLLQNAAAQYMRLVVDLQTGFRGYVISEDDRDLDPYEEARKDILEIGRDLRDKLPENQRPAFNDIQAAVIQFLAEKEGLVQEIKAGRKAEAIQYIKEGSGRKLITEVRKWMVQFEQNERRITQQELTRLRHDRTSARVVILTGGLITLGLIVCALFLIAHSIAVPLVNLAKVVGTTSGELVPVIPVLVRKDEIGDLTRVMQQMSLQIREHLDDLRQSEAALRKLNAHLSASEAKYRGLVDHAPFGIFMTKGMPVTFSNRYNQMLAGLDPDEEVDPDTFRQRIHPEDRERVLTTFSQAVADGRPCEMIFRFLHNDGSIRTILSRRVPIMNLDSSDVVYVGFNIDITTLDNLQSRLRRAEKLATLGQVAAGIAHELRNPLIGIGSTAKVLLDEFETSDPKRGEIDVILTETRRLDRIVNQIVDYARPRQLAPTRFDLSLLVEEVVKLLKPRLEERHLDISTSLSSMASELHADRDQLKQVLLNVVQNAIDATSVGGQAIVITSHELFRDERPGTVIQVKDAGVGIPSAMLPHVFQPFFTSGKRNGTGLGLAICKNIIESHDGDIYVSSEHKKGTIVGIWLPLDQELALVKG
jgi:PAS domain S-box-containing protein